MMLLVTLFSLFALLNISTITFGIPFKGNGVFAVGGVWGTVPRVLQSQPSAGAKQ